MNRVQTGGAQGIDEVLTRNFFHCKNAVGLRRTRDSESVKPYANRIG